VPYAEGSLDTVYGHMKRGLDFTAEQRGANGICLGLRADWNDCLNLGGGQSALTTFLFRWALNDFVEAAERLGRAETGPQPKAIRLAKRAAPSTTKASPMAGYSRHKSVMFTWWVSHTSNWPGLI
jgi:cellobiose phosphorylase